MALVPLFALLYDTCIGAEEIELQLRASWGGGEATTWRGSVRVSQGSMHLDRVLGLEADAPGVTVQSAADAIRVVPRSPHTYDGFDFTLHAPREAVLTIDFTSGNSGAPQRFEVALAQVIAGRFNKDLDGKANRFALQRVAGDQLRFSSTRDHLVFAAGERFEGALKPHLIDGAASTTARCAFKLVSATNKNVVWQREEEVALDETGSAAEIPVTFDSPAEEGVYELVAELHSKRLVAPLVRTKPLAERQVQFVVLKDSADSPTPREWTLVGDFDPAQPKLWERLMRLPTMKMVPGFNKGPLGNEPTGVGEHQGVNWSTLKPGGWQAYPLPVAEVGHPHMLEIEYLTDVEQSLAISVVEPNAAGLVTPLGVDSGIDVTAVAGRASEVRMHRLVFWPRTKSPLLLLANRRSDALAEFGRIRVQAGPLRLPAATGNASSREERLIAAYFDKPLFPENFGVSDGVDARTGRPIDDWQTFYTAANRLAEYLHFSGKNAAVVSVLCEGSALYPSDALQATPKYDMGGFSSLGNDPVRKDVLELVLRVFDREQLRFLPALSLSTPLPELEALLATSTPQECQGIELLAADGRRYIDSTPPRRGMAPYYNLLDPRVQTAVRRVILEVAERYAAHESFSGVALQLTGESYAQFPDEACALDDTTLSRFAADVRLRLPPFDPLRPTFRWEFIQREARDAWIAWRARNVARFYQKVREDLAAIRPNVPLVLLPTDSLDSRRMQSRVRPQLPPRDRTIEAFTQVGLACDALTAEAGVAVARPHLIEPTPLMGGNPQWAELNHSQLLNAALASAPTPAAVHVAEPWPLRLEAFEKVSPFGPQNTRLFMLTHLAATGPEARKPFTRTLTASDAQLIIDGGQLLTLGQEDEVRRVLLTLRDLPKAAFETVAAGTSDAPTQPVVLRRWSDGTATWFYLVNDSPWPVSVEVDLAASAALTIRTLGPAPRTNKLPATGGMVPWKLRLEAYDLVAARVEAPHLEVRSWRTMLDSTADTVLRESVRDLRLRANALRSPTPLTTLANASFEATAAEEPIAGWTVAQGPALKAEIDHKGAKQGDSSLHLVSRAGGDKDSVLWVRSRPIPVPETGRLAVWAWLKAPDARHQPTLRLAIEGRLDGQPYYRRANVGASEDGRATQPLMQEWSPFLFPVDDLPLQGLTELQIGFDLMSAGEVWIDDVQLYDLWFQENERDSLLKTIALADFQIQEGKVGDALQFTEGYWPQFLRRHVAIENTRMATLPTTPAPTPGPSGRNGMFDGVRRWTPRWPFQK